MAVPSMILDDGDDGIRTRWRRWQHLGAFGAGCFDSCLVLIPTIIHSLLFVRFSRDLFIEIEILWSRIIHLRNGFDKASILAFVLVVLTPLYIGVFCAV